MKKKRIIMKILKRNDLYENFEKRGVVERGGGSREKGEGGNEIHAPCACGYDIHFCRYATTSVESFYKYIQVLLILSGHCYLQTL
jgi:hypothetical protein